MLNLPRDRKISMITVYDYPTARIFDGCGFDLFLIGDSVGMVELGMADTRSVTMAMVIHHLEAVRRGTQQTHIVADMPINTYDTPESALNNARRFLEAGADSIKLEGPAYEVIAALTANGIEVMGHTGLTPQTADSLKMAGKTPEEAQRITDEALGLADAGCYAVILEHMPAELAAEITKQLSIPTIGIGAGPDTGGQVLVSSDMLGLSSKVPPFARKFADLEAVIGNAARDYIEAVKNGEFPSAEYYK